MFFSSKKPLLVNTLLIRSVLKLNAPFVDLKDTDDQFVSLNNYFNVFCSFKKTTP